MNTEKQKITVNTKFGDDARAATQPSSAIGSLPKQGILEQVVLPGQPLAYRVRRDIVISAARSLKLEHN